MAFRLGPVVVGTFMEVRALQGGSGESASGLLLPLPPVLTRAYRNPAVLPAFLGGDPGPALAELEQSFRVHPDALLAFTRGVLAARANRMAEAERAFLAAADATSLLPVRGGRCTPLCSASGNSPTRIWP